MQSLAARADRFQMNFRVFEPVAKCAARSARDALQQLREAHRDPLGLIAEARIAARPDPTACVRWYVVYDVGGSCHPQEAPRMGLKQAAAVFKWSLRVRSASDVRESYQPFDTEWNQMDHATM